MRSARVPDGMMPVLPARGLPGIISRKAGWEMRGVWAALFLSGLMAWPVRAQDEPSPALEIVHQDYDIQVTDAGISWVVSDTAYRPLNVQGVEATRRFNLSYAPNYETLDITSAYTLK